jgi:hypothetical protein
VTCDALTELHLKQLEEAGVTVVDHTSDTDNPGGAATLRYTLALSAPSEDDARTVVEEALAGAHPKNLQASAS